VNDWKVIFATVVIFGTGVVTGGLLVNYVEHSHPRAAVLHRNANGTGTNTATANSNSNTPAIHIAEILNKPSFLTNLDARLTEQKVPLTPEQHKAIEKLINDGQGQMRKLVQEVNRSIRQELTPDQRRKYDEMLHPGRSFFGHRIGGAAPTNSLSSEKFTNAPVTAPVTTNLPPVQTNHPAL